MEIVKYLCEFFFTDFWHWLGLLIYLCVIVEVFPIISFKGSKKEEKDGKES